MVFVFLALFYVDTINGQPLISSYTSQIGVRELTGKNDGKQVENYLASVNLQKGNPWCAAFLFWNFQQVNLKAPKSGYSPDWFKTNVVWTKKSGKPLPKIERGMVFGLYFPNLGRVAHVGFIDGEDKNNFFTVEGNTNMAGSREGDGVYKKMRSKKSIFVIAKY